MVRSTCPAPGVDLPGLRALTAALLLLVPAGHALASAALVFRESEIIEAATGQFRQLREVFAAGEDCKVVVREGGDSLAPAGSYIVANASDAFQVDPGRGMVTPLDTTGMEPVSEVPGDAAVLTIADVSLLPDVDEPGPVVLGLPTRHYVYRLRYLEHTPPAAAAPEGSRQWEERHEFWATPWPGGAQLAATWLRLRISEDAGIGWAAPEMRAAVERMQAHGLMLRQIIQRERQPGPGNTSLERERVDRTVVELAERDLAPAEFRMPEGYGHAEFLAPAPDEPATNEAPIAVDRPLPVPADRAP